MSKWDELFNDEANRWKEPHEGLVGGFEQMRCDHRGQTRVGPGVWGRPSSRLSEPGRVRCLWNGYFPQWTDILEGMVGSVRVISPAWLQADMTCLPFTSACFDLVVSMFVIHHNPLEGIRRSIHEVYRYADSRWIYFVDLK